MSDRHGLLLAELADLGMSLARKLHAQAMECDEPEAARELGLAFHRISRSVRQTLALEAKLERDRQRAVRDTASDDARTHRQRVQTRRAHVRFAVERLVWHESEGDEAEGLLMQLDDCLDEAELDQGFPDEAIEAQIDRIREDLGLTLSSPLRGGGPRSGGGEAPPRKPDS